MPDAVGHEQGRQDIYVFFIAIHLEIYDLRIYDLRIYGFTIYDL